MGGGLFCVGSRRSYTLGIAPFWICVLFYSPLVRATFSRICAIIFNWRVAGFLMAAEMLTKNNKAISTDERFDADEYDSKFSNYIFVRLAAKGRVFRNVNFRYTTFDACYLRDAKFDSCDFTGCRFVSTNLHGAKFSGCNFEYATFERTIIDSSILDTEYPKQDNLRARFARTMRMNFQQLGDAAAVNKAMRIELEATGTHLRKSILSSEEYYRNKYRGILWFRSVFEFSLFVIGDFVWGNGESLRRLLRCALIILASMTAFDIFNFGDPRLIGGYWIAFMRSFEIFMGVPAPSEYPKPYVAMVTLVRLIAIGFLLSIIIKKFNRR